MKASDTTSGGFKVADFNEPLLYRRIASQCFVTPLGAGLQYLKQLVITSGGLKVAPQCTLELSGGEVNPQCTLELSKREVTVAVELSPHLVNSSFML
ncbi:hypothetical protein MPTK1_5g16270 [Marchantia polymorpha subsp. ruderalis]|uniref:Uncharacterized protein n=2 Tax=Marchantia polymorpha TaxID=3197 RepID=A0AAF6BIX4_MARPO|nr:hypothetical protein MARPO_0185s0015 [Marchantia polymorpha]BBN11958.1 hypothetical protein Mp_5g16270 [Marchantia polymorpha subsp. ruderalis]|eukprot:PTQ27739.1 hypothetical protein MARPO_0185s0015 [Marchantia polymorpha]